MKNLVTVTNGRPVTTSVKVAERFEKRHDNVMQSINTIISTLDSIGEGALTFRRLTIWINRTNRNPCL